MKKIKELDFVCQNIQKVIDGEMTSKELKLLKNKKIESGEIQPTPKPKSNTFEFNDHHKEWPSNWNQLEREFEERRLSKYE